MTSAAPTGGGLLSDVLRARYAEQIRVALGLAFRGSRATVVDAAVERAGAALGVTDPWALLHRLVRRDAEALDAMAVALTVGETYFFRDPEHFQFFRERALPELRARRGVLPVRVWSAGCATGEEAYSLAIAAANAAGPGAPSVDILGTDVNPDAIAAARQGRYREWSFRRVDASVRERWFVAEGGAFRPVAALGERVRFEVLNLADAAAWPGEVDVIFCRNVLIYFDRETVAAVFARFARSLAPGGVLVLGPSIPWRRAASVSWSSGFRAAGWIAALRNAQLPREVGRLAVPAAPVARARPDHRAGVLRDGVALAPDPRALVEARRLADAGDTAGALRLLDEAVARDALRRELYPFARLSCGTSRAMYTGLQTTRPGRCF